MSLHFILGRSGSGKTSYVRRHICDQLLAEPAGAPIIWLVPEQGTFQAEYALVQEPEIAGILRAQVLSFRRLAYRVLQETGGIALTPLHEEGKQMLLYKVIQRHKEELSLFATSAEQFGFIARLDQLLTEIKRYCLTSQNLNEYRATLLAGTEQSLLAAKLQDISIILHDLEAEFAHRYMDEEDVLALVATQLPHSTYIKQASIWIDGFHGFTLQEYGLLSALLQHAPDVYVTLCLDRAYKLEDKPHHLDLFHCTATTMLKLKTIAHKQGIPLGSVIELGENEAIAPRFRSSPLLAHLEQHYATKTSYLFTTKEAHFQSEHEQVYIRAAVNRRAEVEAVARHMLQLVQTYDVRWRDMAIMVRQIEPYRELIEAIFTEANVPFFMDEKVTVLHHPFVEMTRAALDILLENWHYDAVFRYVKTDFLLTADATVTREQLDQFENYILACGIQGSMWTSAHPWPAEPVTSLELDSEGTTTSQEAEKIRYSAPAWVARCRTLIAEPLLQLARSLKESTNVRNMCEALYQFWLIVGVPHKLEQMSQESLLDGHVQFAREHRQIWGAMLHLLDQMVEIMGEETLSLDLFIRMLDVGLESVNMALVPPALDQVLVAALDRTRPGEVKHVYMLGVNDGVIPLQPVEDGVLTEHERTILEQIGVELAPSAQRKWLDESFILYQACTTASCSLWISYPLADEEGKSLFPSEVVRQMKQMFPMIEEQLALSEPPAKMEVDAQAEFIRYPEGALKQLLIQFRKWKQGQEISAIWWDVYRWFVRQPAWKQRITIGMSALQYRNQVESLTPLTSRKLYGKTLHTSVSRMERFVACPFSHFISYGLHLKARRFYRLQAMDIGQLFHAALHRFATYLQENNQHWSTVSATQCAEIATRIIHELAPQLHGKILYSSKRYEYIASKLEQVIEQAAFVLAEQAKRGYFEPVALEIEFGPNKQLPSLSLPLPNGDKIEISGRIDRIDKADSGQRTFLRVIDYKSSATNLKLQDVYYGLSLQMITYLDVLLTHAEQWLGTTAFPAGAFYFHIHNLLLKTDHAVYEQQAYKQRLKKNKLRGLATAEREVIALMDNELEQGHSDILPVALKKDGTFQRQCDVVTLEQWMLLRQATRSTIQTIGKRMLAGDVRIAPFRLGTKQACHVCSFQSICQFDKQMTGNEYEDWSALTKERVWLALEARGERDEYTE